MRQGGKREEAMHAKEYYRGVAKNCCVQAVAHVFTKLPSDPDAAKPTLARLFEECLLPEQLEELNGVFDHSMFDEQNV